MDGLINTNISLEGCWKLIKSTGCQNHNWVTGGNSCKQGECFLGNFMCACSLHSGEILFLVPVSHSVLIRRDSSFLSGSSGNFLHENITCVFSTGFEDEWRMSHGLAKYVTSPPVECDLLRNRTWRDRTVVWNGKSCVMHAVRWRNLYCLLVWHFREAFCKYSTSLTVCPEPWTLLWFFI